MDIKNIADGIMSLSVLLLTISLVPTILVQRELRASTIPLKTALPMVIALIGITISVILLNLWFTTALNMVQTLLWVVLLVQSIVYRKIKTI